MSSILGMFSRVSSPVPPAVEQKQLARKPTVMVRRKTSNRPKARPKNKKRGSKPKRSFGARVGDVTLREAGDMVGAVIRGGFHLATRLFNVEQKMVDTTFAGTVITQTGSIQCVSLIAQGTDYNQREGLSIGANNLRISVSGVANATNKTNFLRMIVLVDLENHGAVITTGGLFESTGADIYLSPYKHYDADRYKILMDEHIVLIDQQVALNKRFAMPLDYDIQFNSTGATLADIYPGAIFVVLVSDQPTNGPTVAFDARLTFDN